MGLQLPLFIKKQFAKVTRSQIIQPVAPTAQSSVSQTLPAYAAYLGSQGYSQATVRKYFADIKKFAVFIREKKLQEITTHDLQQWIAQLSTKDGEELDPKTVNRKVSAVINYFSWLYVLQAITKDITLPISNARVQSPLPDYLYENEINLMYSVASKDIRTYLIVLLFLEAGIKSNELLKITRADVDLSDPYRPEIWVKHRGKNTKKDRKVALPPQYTEVYNQYLVKYRPDEVIFPYTDRFIQLLFSDLKKLTKIQKEFTPKILRHTHVVRAYKRGEDPEQVFERIGLAPDSRTEAHELYTRLARRGV
jgi:integrase/recombinase XerD